MGTARPVLPGLLGSAPCQTPRGPLIRESWLGWVFIIREGSRRTTPQGVSRRSRRASSSKRENKTCCFRGSY
jgi:hypothetical protein